MTKPDWCHLAADELDRLDHASLIVARAFDATPYLVGSALERPDFRDVDVRVILPDRDYDRMFRGSGTRRTNPFWSLLCASVSEYLSRLTDLRVDFQVQSQSHSNAAYPDGQRHPLGTYPHADGNEGDDDE